MSEECSGRVVGTRCARAAFVVGGAGGLKLSYSSMSRNVHEVEIDEVVLSQDEVGLVQRFAPMTLSIASSPCEACWRAG